MNGTDVEWAEYLMVPTRPRRNHLVVLNLPIVETALRRYPRARHDDLYGHAVEGLIQAVERFRPTLGLFRPYAYRRVRGAVVDGWRDIDHLPSSGRRLLTGWASMVDKLAQKLQRTPTDAEVTLALGLSKVRASRADAYHFDNQAGSDVLDREWNRAVTAGPNPVAAVLEEERRMWLGGLVSKLTERQKVVISLYYYENMSIIQIGEVLGVSDSRVSQIKTQALNVLRVAIRPRPPLIPAQRTPTA